MNYSVKIQSWAGLFGKNRLYISIFYYKVVILELLGGAILGLFEAVTFDNVSIYEAWPIVWLNYCPFSLKYDHF